MMKIIDLHDNGEWHPTSYSPTDADKADHEDSLIHSGDEEGGTHQEAEEDKCTGPNIAEEEWHVGQLDGLATASSLSPPFEDGST